MQYIKATFFRPAAVVLVLMLTIELGAFAITGNLLEVRELSVIVDSISWMSIGSIFVLALMGLSFHAAYILVAALLVSVFRGRSTVAWRAPYECGSFGTWVMRDWRSLEGSRITRRFGVEVAITGELT